MSDSTGPQPDYEILGVSLLGPRPLSAIHLRWPKGLTVLYGANGAGKSTIIRGISQALRGEAPVGGAAYVHVKINQAAEPLDWESDYFTLELLAGIAEWVKSAYFHPDGAFFFENAAPHGWQDYEALLESDRFDEYIRASVGELWASSPHCQAVTAQMIQHRTFTLRAASDSRWEILPAIPAGADSEVLKTIFELVRAGQYEVTEDGPRLAPPSDGTLLHAMQRNESRLQHALLLAATAPPAWVPIPVGMTGTLDSWYLPDVIEVSDESLDRATQEYLLSGGAGPVDELFEFEPDTGTGALVGVSHELTEVLGTIGTAADRVIKGLLPRFPALRLELNPPAQWLQGRFVSWVATDGPSKTDVPLSALSEAQHRWASLAIQTALWAGRTRSHHSVMLVDEPEKALHSAAAQRVATELASLAETVPVIVTSHSAAFLNLPDAHLIHVERDIDGWATTIPMPAETTQTLRELTDRLGLTPIGRTPTHPTVADRRRCTRL